MSREEKLKPGAQIFWAEALEVPRRFGHKEIGLYHFLLVLLERYGPMAESLASGLRAAEYYRQVQQSLREGEIGEPVGPQELLEEAVRRAAGAGKPCASERDLAAVLLQRAGWTLVGEPALVVSKPSPVEVVKEGEKGPSYRPRARRATPVLERFGRDLCQEALAGKLPPILGREVELQAVMETLCRFTKRNPLLIGPAGVGKTAIVEALAQRVVRGEVPPPLQGIRIFLLAPSALVSGAGVVGELEKRMHAILEEASQDGVVLFIDEVHTIVGSGGVRQVSDVGSLLKPALAKGEVACIGATTDEEFHRFIEQDRALERRFQPLRIQELSADATLEILRALQERASRERGVTFSDEALRLVVLLAQQHLRNRYFPDKAIDIFEQSVAFAVLHRLSEVTPSIVREVVERMVGVPVDLGADLSRRLGEVKQHLVAEAFCPEPVADALVRRLEITMRGLDVSPIRPNGVLLVTGTAGEMPELTAQVLAQALYGDRARLITVDMTRFTHPADVTWFTGAPPGYVGHENVMGFHLQLTQQPWSVVLFKNVEASHPRAQEVLAQALQAGFFTDAQGRRAYLSDAVVVLTATLEEQAKRPLGFGRGEEEGREEERADIEVTPPLVPDLLAQLDLRWRPQRPTVDRVQRWLERWVLPGLSERYQRQGLEIDWDPTILKWLAEAVLTAGDLGQGERLVEEQVLPLLIPYLDTPGKVTLSYEKDEGVQVQHMKGA
jgi:ATP-dependent Clp protease ATP-binding subunit ClpC